MKRKSNSVLMMAAITAGAILCFQLYWVINVFSTSRENLNREVLQILQKSINRYELYESSMPLTLQANDPSLYVMKDAPKRNIDADTVNDPKKKDGPSGLSTKGLARTGSHRVKPETTTFKFEYLKLDLPAQSANAVRLMIAELIHLRRPLQLAELKRIFNEELKINGLGISWQLIVLHNQTRIPEGKTAVFVSSSDHVVVEAVLSHTIGILFQKTLIPGMLSLLLILLSAGSLWYMVVIINRQRQLDQLKNSFIDTITHELRTPLSILKSSHELMNQVLSFEKQESKISKYLRIDADVIDAMDHNVDRILEISKYELGVMQIRVLKINLHALVQEVIRQFELDGTGNILYTFNLKDPDLITDPYMVKSIVSNIIDNAFKYGGNKVRILIKAPIVGKGWIIEIADNGSGIPAQYLPFIFDKFYRVPSGDLHDVKGYGIGLSYVKQLVRALNGKIAVQSARGSGTSFTIHIPRL